MTPGQLFYKYFFKPTLPLRYNLTHFGLNGSVMMMLGERAMKRYIPRLAPVELSNDNQTPIFCFLTGEKYWYQTIFAIKSLHKYIETGFGVRIYSDGSLTEEHKHVLKQFAPGIKIVGANEVIQQLDNVLPKDKFPSLRFLRDWHPFFKRMIDIHCSEGWSIHLDSDMLFFNYPQAFIDAHRHKTAIYMKDLLAESYYADDEEMLKEKFGIDCLHHVNGGIIAYNGSGIDYIDLEEKATILLNHYKDKGPARIEQTLMSYILYKQNAQALDDVQYKIYYDDHIDGGNTEVVRHYIFKAKLPFLSKEWKKIL